MRISQKRTLAGAVVAATAISVLGLGSGQAAAAPPVPQVKPTSAAAPADPGSPVESRTARQPVVTTFAAQRALLSVQARVADYVAKNATDYTFGTYTDAATGAVVIDTDAPDTVVKSLTNFKDDKSLTGVTVTTHAEKTQDAYNRRDDVPAFYGGGGLLANNALCSTGYAVKNSVGTRFMVTAGHCFANGTTVRTESNLRTVGVVQNRLLASLGNGPADMELLAGQSYAGRVFTGGVVSSSSIPVVSAGSAYVGYSQYCHSGRTTGEQCGHKVNSVNAQVCTATGCKSPVIAYTGGVVQQGGDSGGAFYAKDGSGAWIRGHVIAGNSTTGYVEPYTKVASRLGVSIVTG